MPVRLAVRLDPHVIQLEDMSPTLHRMAESPFTTREIDHLTRLFDELYFEVANADEPHHSASLLDRFTRAEIPRDDAAMIGAYVFKRADGREHAAPIVSRVTVWGLDVTALRQTLRTGILDNLWALSARRRLRHLVDDSLRLGVYAHADGCVADVAEAVPASVALAVVPVEFEHFAPVWRALPDGDALTTGLPGIVCTMHARTGGLAVIDPIALAAVPRAR